MDVVVVESPAKAKTINKYLGAGYKVLASYGHVRDLPSKDGSVRPDDDFAMDWEIDSRAKKRLDEIAAAVRGAKNLFLATDPDREGEAISWHVREVLRQRKVLEGVEVRRVVFNEITKTAIQAAFTHPRDLDKELVDAYLARRALDYLVGFTLSPVLWRKLPGARSAGRVQSVALRLVCERELEIEKFKSQEYWSVAAILAKGDEAAAPGAQFRAMLTHLDGAKLDKMSLGDRAQAEAAKRAVEAASFAVRTVERKQQRRSPPPPFITSSLQMEASRKLNLGAKRTMQIAQQLYEGVSLGGEIVGLISYMRTDGVQMAGEAVDACRRLIGREFGERYLPGSPRVYRTRAVNAQEAHEAIRPTDLFRRPDDIARYLDTDQLRLYTLIWKRTVASQMELAVLDQVAADIASADGRTVLRATGSVIAFDGFLKLYHEDRDDAEAGGDDESERRLPDLKEGEALARLGVEAEQHFTQPPPRYSEASLVKRLEELGIGRPSTYASILSVLQDRKYVRLEKKRFIPEDRGRLVTTFLTSFFERYVEYSFTADLEQKLDDISGGRIDWKAVLRDFWTAFSRAVDETKDLRVSQVLDALDEALGPHFFPPRADGSDPRACPACGTGRLNLKLGRFGAFIGCGSYPECRFTRPLEVVGEDDAHAAGAAIANGPKVLGTDPESDLVVTLRKGPYGFYVQLGESPPPPAKGKRKKKSEDEAAKPKRQSVPKGQDPAELDLDRAMALLRLPREVGRHPESNEPITAAIGRFGPYLKYQGNYVSLKGDDDVLTIGLNRAVALIAESPKKAKARELGPHPADAKPVTLRKGRYGAYVQHGGDRANLPRGADAEAATLDEAVALLAERKQKAQGGKSKKTKAAGDAAEATPKAKAAGRRKSAKAAKPEMPGGASGDVEAAAPRPRKARVAAPER